MKKRIICKALAVAVILLFVGVGIQPAFAKFINEEEDKLTSIGHKNYYYCKIITSKNAVDGRAWFFPGFFRLLGDGNVNRAYGILIAYDYLTGYISFNDDTYYDDWIIAFILSFNGKFINYWDMGIYPVFEMDGTAEFARVYYRL